MPELPKTYDPKSVEPKWYQRWLANRRFPGRPEIIQTAVFDRDAAAEYHRRFDPGACFERHHPGYPGPARPDAGLEVLWLPGMDHAGIGTQTAVEKWLKKNEGVTRHDLGREKFLRRVLEWQDKHGGIIIQQLKRLGCSCDWSRQRYTFDEGYVRAVQDGVRRSLPERSDLSGTPDDQLGSGRANRAFG